MESGRGRASEREDCQIEGVSGQRMLEEGVQLWKFDHGRYGRLRTCPLSFRSTTDSFIHLLINFVAGLIVVRG